MKLDRSQAKSIRSRSKHLLTRRRFKEAVDLLTEALKYFPRCYKFYRLRALAYACLHDYAASRSDAEMVITLAPESPEGYYFKGAVHKIDNQRV